MRNEKLNGTEALKKELTRRIQGFSEEQLRQIMDYLEMIGYKPQSPENTEGKKYSPLHEYIGGVSHGMLAEEIDISLYG